jgi:hypothetical protein
MEYVNSYKDLIGDYFGDKVRENKKYKANKNWHSEYYERNKDKYREVSKIRNKAHREIRLQNAMTSPDLFTRTISGIKLYFGSSKNFSTKINTCHTHFMKLLRKGIIFEEGAELLKSANLPTSNLTVVKKRKPVVKNSKPRVLRDVLYDAIAKKYGTLKNMSEQHRVNITVLSHTINNYELIKNLLENK